MEAGKRTIRDIFNRGRNLEIPFFQRAYVWDTDQWERFLQDMVSVSKTKRKYFLGSVILKQESTTSDKDSKLSVVDGQQRLTTLNIFFKVLCLKKGQNDEFKDTFTKQRDKSIILLHNHNDIEQFELVVNLEELVEFKSEDVSTSNILGAYHYFKEQMNEELVNEIDHYDILDNVQFVGIDLAQGEDEQQIFDTINSLGVRLTTAELLKNHLFKRNEIDLYETYWKSIFEKNDEQKFYWDQEVTTGREKRSLIDLFFYAFLQIQIQDPALNVTSEDKLYFSKVDGLFDSYRKFLKNYFKDKNALLELIKEYAKIFRANVDVDIVNKEMSAEPGSDRMNAIIFGNGSSTLLPYYLYVCKNVGEDEQTKLFGVVENYIIRRIIVRASNKNYNQLFSGRLISNQIKSAESFIRYMLTQDEKVNFFPSNTDLKKAFGEERLTNYNAATVLYFLESATRDPKHSTALLGLKKYSLEHIMPKKWRNHWSLPKEITPEERDKKLLTLGNLTIITQSLNTSIRDANWEIKKCGNGKNHGLKVFSGGIETLAPYLEEKEWNEETIEKRAGDLYEKSVKQWPYPEVFNDK
ncbi:MAG: DUF262 domain-containing HNH endonuclease family protein [Saprospiraceae bacterium]